jgi:ParB family transcriptional regulator, chromosome partitioning protein
MERRKDEPIHCFSPFRCRMWESHDRSEEEITEESCRDLINSINKYGQLAPVLGRELTGDDRHDVELIYGARRLFTARQLNIPLRVELRSLRDREGIVAMDAENRHRKDISPYERGRSYLQWLREDLFPSQEEIARELKISASQVSRLLKMAKLPAVIVEAFHSPAEICEAWVQELASALEDSRRRDYIIRRARQFTTQSPRPAAKDVCRILFAAACGGRPPRERTEIP